MINQETAKRAGLVLLAGILFNLSIGVFYAWSVIKARLTAPLNAGGWAWSSTQAGLPYTFIILFFALGLLLGGSIQDKNGPRWVAVAGGALTGLGLLLAGLYGNNVTVMTLCYGVISGTGIGFGYGCVTPAALKWFHPGKKGLVSGLTIGGFGLSAVYLAPLTNTLMQSFGIQKTLVYIGLAVMLVSVPLALVIQNPPDGYIPPAPRKSPRQNRNEAAAVDFTRKEMLKTKRFYMMFVMFLLPSSVGLMIIGNITKIASLQADIADTAFLALLVSLIALSNSMGRVLGGLMSDKIGRINALFVALTLQALNMAGFMFYKSLPPLLLGIIVTGLSYGTLASVFPSLTADQYGLKNYGANYGVLFLAWGLSGLIAPVMADFLYDAGGSFQVAYVISAIMMTLMIFVNVLLKRDLTARG